MTEFKPPIALNITARDDRLHGWIGVVSSDTCKEFKRVALIDLDDGGCVMLQLFAIHVANHLKNNYPGRKFQIDTCEVEDDDDAADILPKMIMRYVEQNNS